MRMRRLMRMYWTHSIRRHCPNRVPRIPSVRSVQLRVQLRVHCRPRRMMMKLMGMLYHVVRHPGLAMSGRAG